MLSPNYEWTEWQIEFDCALEYNVQLAKRRLHLTMKLLSAMRLDLFQENHLFIMLSTNFHIDSHESCTLKVLVAIELRCWLLCAFCRYSLVICFVMDVLFGLFSIHMFHSFLKHEHLSICGVYNNLRYLLMIIWYIQLSGTAFFKCEQTYQFYVLEYRLSDFLWYQLRTKKFFSSCDVITVVFIVE
jgi:hypothetical protein